MSKITHIDRNFSDMKSGSKKLRELFPGLLVSPKLAYLATMLLTLQESSKLLNESKR
jgi:hypothetical protein